MSGSGNGFASGAVHASVDGLCRKLDYRFAHPELLECALTHRSAGSNNNERLEFLGDAVLNFLIADELYRRFSSASEGELSRARANLVRGSTLAALASLFELGNYLRLGPGELKSGGFRRESILAGALEAVIGAVYLDGGFDVCRALVLSIYRERLASISPKTHPKDPKTRLQEYLQSQKMPLPTYSILTIEGDAHRQKFQVECVVENIAPCRGEGANRRIAEQNAARKALQILGCE